VHARVVGVLKLRHGVAREGALHEIAKDLWSLNPSSGTYVSTLTHGVGSVLVEHLRGLTVLATGEASRVTVGTLTEVIRYVSVRSNALFETKGTLVAGDAGS
jgi:hypothetical protein